CLVNEIDPELGLAAVRVLERLGFEVEVPLDQTCCGQPAYNAGFLDEAQAAARHTLAVLGATEGPIVVPSGSCGDMLVHQYPLLFRDEPEWLPKAEAVAGRCREFSQFLVEARGAALPGAQLEASVAYHPSCHLLRGLGVREPPRALLSAVEGVRLAEVQEGEECCGFGGLFAVQTAEISTDLLERKLGTLAASGAHSPVRH